MSRQHRGTGSIFRRRGRGNWIIKLSHRGRIFAESSGTTNHAIAVKLLKRRQHELERNQVVGPKAEKLTLKQMLDAKLLAGELAHNRTSPTSNVQALIEFFGPEERVVDITLDRVNEYVKWRLALQARTGRGPISKATANRDLAVLRHAFRLAVEAKLMSRDHPPAIKLADESDNVRQGFVDPAEFERIVEGLPEYLKPPVTFLYVTGWRVGAMRTLEWLRDFELEFDADGKITGGTVTLQAANAKNKRSQRLPLTGKLLEVIRRARGIDALLTAPTSSMTLDA